MDVSTPARQWRRSWSHWRIVSIELAELISKQSTLDSQQLRFSRRIRDLSSRVPSLWTLTGSGVERCELRWLPIPERVKFKVACLVRQSLSGQAPHT